MIGRRLSPPDLNPEGITPMDWVRKIRGRRVGQVERVTGDMAYVNWFDGTHDVVCCIYLRREPSDKGGKLDRRGE